MGVKAMCSCSEAQRGMTCGNSGVVPLDAPSSIFSECRALQALLGDFSGCAVP